MVYLEITLKIELYLAGGEMIHLVKDAKISIKVAEWKCSICAAAFSFVKRIEKKV